MTIFNKFKTNKKTYDEKMDTLDKWEAKKTDSSEKLILWSLYSKNTKSSKTTDKLQAKFVGINIPKRRTKPRRKIVQYEVNIYTFIYNKRSYYFDIDDVDRGAYSSSRLLISD